MKSTSKKVLLFILILLAVLIIGIVIVRMFSQEDDWVCKDGIWVKHGQPSAIEPDSPCQ